MTMKPFIPYFLASVAAAATLSGSCARADGSIPTPDPSPPFPPAAITPRATPNPACPLNEPYDPPWICRKRGGSGPTTTTGLSQSSTATPTQIPLPAVSPLSPITANAHTITAANADRLSHLHAWGKGTARSLAWSPDGKLIAVATSLGVYLLDSSTLDQLRFIPVSEPVSRASFSPDGRLLATGGTHVRLWDPFTGDQITSLDGGFKGYIYSVKFSPGGSWLAALGTDGGGGDPPARLAVWRVNDFELATTIENNGCGYGSAFSFSPDGSSLAFQSCGLVNIVKVTTGEVTQALQTEFYSFDVAFTNDGLALFGATRGGDYGTVALDGEQFDLIFNSDYNTEFTLSPDGSALAIPGAWYDNEQVMLLEVWGLEEGNLRFTSPGARDVVFSPDGEELATLSYDGTLTMADAVTGAPLRALHWPGVPTSVSFGRIAVESGSSRLLLATGNSLGEVSLIDPATFVTVTDLTISSEPVQAIAFDSSGSYLAVSTGNDQASRISVIRPLTGEVLRSFELHDSYDSAAGVLGLAFSRDTGSIAAKSTADEVIAWDLASGAEIHDPEASLWFDASEIGATPGGHLLAFPLAGDTVKAIDRFDNSLLFSYAITDEDPLCQFRQHHAVSPDLHSIAIGCDIPWISVWALGTERPPTRLTGHATVGGDGFLGTVVDMAYSPFGHLLASTGYDGQVVLWETLKGVRIRSFSTHVEQATSLAWSQDGAYLATASLDGTMRLWGLK